MTRADPPRTLRLAELIGLRVETTDGDTLGTVRDVRLRRAPTDTGGVRLLTAGVLLGRRHHEVRWGYDRHPRQGPLALGVLARLLHRTSYLPWQQVESLDLETGVLRVRASRDARTRSSGGTS
jgi:hypothetical protein